MERTLEGQVAVVTGASHGLGKAVAARLVELGARVVMIARDPERLESAAAPLRERGSVLPISCDVSDREQVEQAAARIVEEMGQVDILVNNAGIPAPRSVAETTFSDWDEVIGVNLSGYFYLTRALWDVLTARPASYIINISGTNGVRGSSSPAYSSAKFGLTGLTRSLALNGREHNLRATVLYPGGMDTGWRGAPIGVRPAEETMDPDQVARYIGYLLSTPSAFVVNEAVLNPINDTFV